MRPLLFSSEFRCYFAFVGKNIGNEVATSFGPFWVISLLSHPDLESYLIQGELEKYDYHLQLF